MYSTQKDKIRKMLYAPITDFKHSLLGLPSLILCNIMGKSYNSLGHLQT